MDCRWLQTCSQRFVASAPNQIWLADITYVPTGEGWLYLADVLDLATRKVVGWAMRDHLRSELATAALLMAIQRRRPAPGLTHHSDRGGQLGFKWSSQHHPELIAVPRRVLRRGFAIRASCAVCR